MNDVRVGEQSRLNSEDRWNAGRDVIAALLLTIALLLPWNLAFGVGIPDSSLWLFVLVITATVAAWAGLVTSHTGRAKRSTTPPSSEPGRLRLVLALPYVFVVLGFVLFAVVQAMRFGGNGDVPPGVGPGALAGLAGALLAAQPPLNQPARAQRWLGAIRVIGVVAAILMTVAVLANLYWRTRFPLEAIAAGTYGGQNVAVVATTIVYGVVDAVVVLTALRWTLSARPSSRLALVGLGAATVLGAVLVWVLGVGRDIDAFHGIAQTTSTAGVGLEGYVAWVAVAAIAAPWALRAVWTNAGTIGDWREGVRKCLALVAFWCIGSALLRIFDLIVAASLDMPYSPYDSIALLAFDVVACAAALWVRANVSGRVLHPVVLSASAAVLFVLTVCRVVVGVGLAPRIMYSAEPPGLRDAIYGNMLAQQITGTFDVVVCWLAFVVVVVAVVVLQKGVPYRRQSTPPSVAVATAPEEPAVAQSPAMASTTRYALPVDPEPATALPSSGVSAAAARTSAPPRISRATEAPTQAAPGAGRKPKIARVLAESTQRFGAGTTYTGTGPTRPPSQH